MKPFKLHFSTWKIEIYFQRHLSAIFCHHQTDCQNAVVLLRYRPLTCPFVRQMAPRPSPLTFLWKKHNLKRVVYLACGCRVFLGAFRRLFRACSVARSGIAPVGVSGFIRWILNGFDKRVWKIERSSCVRRIRAFRVEPWRKTSRKRGFTSWCWPEVGCCCCCCRMGITELNGLFV